MTNGEKHIEKLLSWYKEAVTEDGVCYLTSDDKNTLAYAIKWCKHFEDIKKDIDSWGLREEPSSSEIPNKSENPTSSDDCISRKAALEIYDEWFATCNIADKKESPKAKINALPPVTPIRPKGHWKLVQRGKRIDVCCSNCEATRIKEWAYNYTIDQLDKEDVKGCLESDDMRYCPYCGSDNREESV